MEKIADRIKRILELKKITKSEMARRIGISSSSVSTMCSGKSNPSNQTVTMICREFGINEEWLRTGQGEMFTPVAESELDRLAKKHRLRVKDYILIEKLLNMDNSARDGIYDYMMEVVKAVEAEKADPNSLAFPDNIPGSDNSASNIENKPIRDIAEKQKRAEKDIAAAEAAYAQAFGIASRMEPIASSTAEGAG